MTPPEPDTMRSIPWPTLPPALRRLLPGVFLGTLFALCAAPSAAQNFNPQDRQIGNLVVAVDRLVYPVEGTTAQEIYDGLRRNRGGWFTIQRTYGWNYQASGGNTGSCRLNNFELLVRATLRYPVWNAPDGADPQLVAAWGAFVEQLEAIWAEWLEEDRSLARRMQRSVETMSEPCTMASQVVRRRWERFTGENTNDVVADANDGGARMTWPPEGFGLTVDANAPIAPAPSDGAQPGADRAPDGGGDGRVVGNLQDAVLFDAIPELPASFEAAASEDFSRAGVSNPALIMGLIREGSILGVEPVGAADSDLPAPDPNGRFAFPGLSELMVSVLAAALDGGGLMSLDAPVSTWLTTLDGPLGQATLRQLLSQRAGLHDAAPPASTGWGDVLDGLGSGGLMTEPGAIFSYSRYSVPLAARAIEVGIGQPIQSLMQAAILDPLGMTGTLVAGAAMDPASLAPGARIPSAFDPVPTGGSGPADGPTYRGLPLLVTTVPDVARFLASIADGTVRLMEPTSPGGASPTWVGGVWWHETGGMDQVSLVCGPGEYGGGAGFSLMLQNGTGVVLWARDTWPNQSARFLMAATSRELEGAADPWWFGGPYLASTLDVGSWSRCAWPPSLTLDGQGPGERVRPEEIRDWLGSYGNGDLVVGLDDAGDHVLWSGSPLDVVRLEDGRYATRRGAQLIFPFSLETDGGGRRYITAQGKAFLHRGPAAGTSPQLR